jgi:hypothetical protein
MIKSGLFPSQIKAIKKCTVWPSNEVAAIVAAIVEGRTEKEIQALVKQLESERTDVFDQVLDSLNSSEAA